MSLHNAGPSSGATKLRRRRLTCSERAGLARWRDVLQSGRYVSLTAARRAARGILSWPSVARWR
eukprot:6816764-Prymnesium_polylepis.2